ncbi:hypothetical protein BJX68DRAFT_266860 [Aspergillus pseudodeflectus]|uniref:Uncharacterized protein n=1 Tax=Aspergillus pseudodeflectus TaxID=176178 RepID=A0ABR4KCQ0_9EURO
MTLAFSALRNFIDKADRFNDGALFLRHKVLITSTATFFPILMESLAGDSHRVPNPSPPYHHLQYLGIRHGNREDPRRHPPHYCRHRPLFSAVPKERYPMARTDRMGKRQHTIHVVIAIDSYGTSSLPNFVNVIIVFAVATVVAESFFITFQILRSTAPQGLISAWVVKVDPHNR